MGNDPRNPNEKPAPGRGNERPDQGLPGRDNERPKPDQGLPGRKPGGPDVPNPSRK